MNSINDIVISQQSVVSLHTQLHHQLRHLILSGSWAYGSRLPSEMQFSKHLNISRSTVRLALQHAEIEGLIERRAGKGTYVAFRKETHEAPRLIAFVTANYLSESQHLMLNGAEKEVNARGYRIIFCNTRSSQEEIETLHNLRSDNIAGVLLWPNYTRRNPEDTVIQHYHIHVPVIFMDRHIEGLDYDCVTSDNYQGAYALMQHLISLGHRDIVFLSHRTTHILTVAERQRAYEEAMLQAGLLPQQPWLIGPNDREIDGMHVVHAYNDPGNNHLQEIVNCLRDCTQRPTAIFAVNDYVAILAMKAIAQAGMRIPDDISVAGFDDTDLAAYLAVPLTTVAQDTFAIGKRAAQILINRIEGDDSPANLELIPTQLRVRNSTAVPVTV